MYLPILNHESTDRRLSRQQVVLGLAVLMVVAFGVSCAAQESTYAPMPRPRMHDSDQWAAIEAHLPNPATASSQQLETQADILRARRFPEDALDYYRYAMARGGDTASLMNKLGLTELEMRNIELARGYFTRVVKANKKNAQGWNNLGAVEFLDGMSDKAVTDYKRASKLNKHEAIYHANLATAYFERKDYPSAQHEIATAMKLDPRVFERDGNSGGLAAHVLSSEDRARFAFEMARLYARNGMETEMLQSLARACEAGMDVQREMRHDPALAKYEADERVLVLVHNAQALHGSKNTAANATRTVVTPLGPEKTLTE